MHENTNEKHGIGVCVWSAGQTVQTEKYNPAISAILQ